MEYRNLSLMLCGLFAADLLGPEHSGAQESRLDVILSRGEIRIGTTGDFKPFTYLAPETGQYEGLDIAAATYLGQSLGVHVRFVPTTWSELTSGILQNRYDVAMGGITRTLERQKIVGLTDPYFTVGKVMLIRKADRGQFQTLDDIDRSSVTIGVNPGGTNEAFVRNRLIKATIQVIEDNLQVPGRVAAGDVDVMITDNVEAVLAARRDSTLFAVNPDMPFTRDDFAYMTLRDDPVLLNWLNLWVDQMKRDGSYGRLREIWIGQ